MNEPDREIVEAVRNRKLRALSEASEDLDRSKAAIEVAKDRLKAAQNLGAVCQDTVNGLVKQLRDIDRGEFDFDSE